MSTARATDAPNGVLVRLNGERGSLVLALLVAMMGLTIGTVALASARMADRAVRRDRSYTVVLQAADAGVQHALSRLNTPGGSLTDQTTPVAVGEHTFTYDVTPVSASGGSAYEVRSTATAPDGEQRVVVATLQQETRFPYALFADQAITFRGANFVDSYSSEALCAPLPLCAWDAPYDGVAAVATNETIDYNGSAWAERTVLHDWESDPDLARCMNGSPGPVYELPPDRTDPCVVPQLQTEDEPLDLTTPAELAFIQDMVDQCNAEQAANHGRMIWDDWIASQDTVAIPATLMPHRTRDFHCVTDLVFDEDTVVAPLGSSLTLRPVVIVVRDSISFEDDRGSGPTVNCLGTCNRETSVQFPRHLQIYTAAALTIDIEPQTEFAGVLYAPRANCQAGAAAGGSAPANVTIFGAVVCDNINQVGGWELYYDRALEGLGTGRYRVASWREEVAP